MSGADEEWVKAAMTDDAMVVELLVRLNRSPPAPPPPPSLPLKQAALPLEWSVRQRRSKPLSVTNNPKKTAHRGSPTTPLSWSGATSVSGGSGGGAGGFEESSRPPPLKLSNTTRSKVNGDSEKNSSKRSRKKKTLAELKEEENLLIKERRDLKREIAALRTNLEKQRSTNENLKRMKLEYQPDVDRGITCPPEESVSDQLPQNTISCNPSPSTMPQIVKGNDAPIQSSSSNLESDSKFVLPDLNMPFEEEPISNGFDGVS